MFEVLDRRVRRTKLNFCNHFIDLIKEKGYSNVSVKDIVDRADYNRSTFYHYYKDKEDLTEELVTEMFKKMEISFKQGYSTMDYVTIRELTPKYYLFYEHIYEYKKFYSLLRYEDSIPGLLTNFMDNFRALYKVLVYKTDEKEILTDEFYREYIIYGLFGLILEWIKTDFYLTPIELAENIINIPYLRIHSVKLAH
ncbi:TetR/AcrR family transcriptional regulator [Ureibacillus acetophenoni]|uniref:TetR family transcriptional regulator n=1 Tax=Ureibacillus acetophenoni TaxID=614649 RepID=A0A285URI4_9BACL|nr:TetR/AcrR family transcriptional regulator [Ureibacillus acetophenoni]SOC44442.1 TetR family transcriptional regulator [Ureibacillus acetophenoni]